MWEMKRIYLNPNAPKHQIIILFYLGRNTCMEQISNFLNNMEKYSINHIILEQNSKILKIMEQI
jgi:hypothetical protein